MRNHLAVRVRYRLGSRNCKAKKSAPTYYQPEDVTAILSALNEEPGQWRTLVLLLLVSGCRRGEALGLKWGDVSFEYNRIHICRNVLYTKERGVYVDTPKTENSTRFISLPAETMAELRHHKARQAAERLRLGDYYENQGFVFTQENGSPVHPCSVTSWLAKFSKRHDLPHLNPHGFRHTMASMLIYNGVDAVTVSHRLGHDQVSTTTDIYRPHDGGCRFQTRGCNFGCIEFQESMKRLNFRAS